MLLTSIIIISSCRKDWLDVKTRQDLAIPSTLKDFQALLDNASGFSFGAMNSTSPGLGMIGGEEFYITDANYTARAQIEKNAYTWNKQFPYVSVLDWTKAYGSVVVCNIILEGLTKIQLPSSNSEYNNVKGQALFNRARTFYELTQIWAPPYDATTANSDLGIPIRLEADLNVRTVRSSVKENYDKIINDLIEAVDLLPLKALYKTRASKLAAFALLARIYLSMGLYDKAGYYADLCLTNYNVLLDYNQLVASNAAPFSRMNNEVIFESQVLNYLTTGSNARIDQNFKNLYSTDDIRSIAFFGVSGGLITFKGNYSGSSTQRFNGLATDEVYLIRAEYFARANKVKEAMDDLNNLLKTRWKKVNGVTTYIDQIALNAEDALKKILIERRKQLIFRGIRWSDLRRLNREDRFRITLTRTVVGQSYTLGPDSYKYTFPIPDDIISMTGISQNIGWE